MSSSKSHTKRAFGECAKMANTYSGSSLQVDLEHISNPAVWHFFSPTDNKPSSSSQEPKTLRGLKRRFSDARMPTAHGPEAEKAASPATNLRLSSEEWAQALSELAPLEKCSRKSLRADATENDADFVLVEKLQKKRGDQSKELATRRGGTQICVTITSEDVRSPLWAEDIGEMKVLAAIQEIMAERRHTPATVWVLEPFRPATVICQDGSDASDLAANPKVRKIEWAVAAIRSRLCEWSIGWADRTSTQLLEFMKMAEEKGLADGWDELSYSDGEHAIGDYSIVDEKFGLEH